MPEVVALKEGEDINDFNQKNLIGHAFTLTKWPLLSLILVKTNDEYRLFYSIHHIISDGWSMGIFIKELTRIYRAEETATTAALPVLKVQYKDYAGWQNAMWAAASEKQEQDWVSKLQGTL